jgi:threonine synthase
MQKTIRATGVWPLHDDRPWSISAARRKIDRRYLILRDPRPPPENMSVDYISTRGEAPALRFSDALLAGLARDGGLYVPREWPAFSRKDIRAMRGQSYQEIAFRVIEPFTAGEIEPEALRSMIDEAYASFRHPAVAPLVQSGANSFVLELFHGPTLAFKDVAMQLIARLMDHVLAKRGERATIVGATSGDTGGAAIEAFAGRDRTDIFILFPEGRVSPVQQRQMTTSKASNVHALALKGNFDDCQDMVKAMFNHAAFRDQVRLSGVNSINWARIMAQIVYYFTSLPFPSARRTGKYRSPYRRAISVTSSQVTAPSAWDCPSKLVVATNENDILARTLRTGRYEMRGVQPTTSPSMDIQISSNFERLLFDANDRDAGLVRRAMDGLKQSGAFDIAAPALKAIRKEFRAGRASERQVKAMIRDVQALTGYVLDPHTAVGVHVATR